MNSIILALTISGFVCPSVSCAEIFVCGEYIACCYEGRALEPVAMCGDNCIRIDLKTRETSRKYADCDCFSKHACVFGYAIDLNSV